MRKINRTLPQVLAEEVILEGFLEEVVPELRPEGKSRQSQRPLCMEGMTGSETGWQEW